LRPAFWVGVYPSGAAGGSRKPEKEKGGKRGGNDFGGVICRQRKANERGSWGDKVDLDLIANSRMRKRGWGDGRRQNGVCIR